ncbi:MAG: M56 family metallopeptidase [Fimbriimonas sp.]|nr:M56 family metallopeptidase [Fimbriimonas sp.]
MSDFVFSTVSTALLRSVPVAMVGLALLLLLRKSSGANRHVVCVVTLMLLLAIPALELIPQRQNVVIPVVGQVMSLRVAQAPQALEKVPSIRAASAAVEQVAPSLSLAKVLFGIYLLVALWLAIRHLASFFVLSRALAKAKRLPLSVPYTVAISDSVSVPLATWWKRPTIVLPASSMDWSEARRATSIEHEAAHIRRGDLLFGWLSFLARLFYWPNPLVWVLCAKLFESSEAATDDCVLRSGVNATDYAEVLVQTAAESRRGTPIFSPAMARSSKVGRRVQAILDPVRERGGASPATALATVVVLGVSTLAMGRIGSGLQDLSKVAIPNSNYKDLLEGSTVPGEASNGFAGVSADGRKVLLVQVQRWTPSGVEAWKPDGTPLAVNQQIPDDWHRHNPAELHLYSQFQNDGSIDDSGAGIGSGPFSPGDPDRLTFAGGGPIRHVGTTQTIMSILEVPQVGTSGTVSVTFGYSEQLGKPIYTAYPNGNHPNRGSIPATLSAEFPTNFEQTVHLAYPAYGTPFVFDEHGESVKDGHGGFVHKKVLSTKLTYTELAYNSGNHSVEPEAYRVGTLAPIEHDWNEGRQRNELYDFSYYWPVPPKEIDHIDIKVHKAYHVVFLNFRLRPNHDKP